jgi:hypothetical protein
MRSDMHKVIVEEPRHGGGPNKNNRRANLPDELLPKKEGMRRPYSNRKWFGEHLGPLKRWLRSNVGRPWNDVYSEAAQVIKPDNVVANHIRVHMFQWIERHTFMRGDEVWCYSQSRELPISEIGSYSRWPTFYVHPKTGIFWEAPVRRRKHNQTEEASDRKWVSENLLLQKLNGCWFACHLRPFGDKGPAFDLVLRKLISPWDAPAVYRWRTVYCHRKQQLSKEELKKHGLRNALAARPQQRVAPRRVQQNCASAVLLNPALIFVRESEVKILTLNPGEDMAKQNQHEDAPFF